MKKTSQFKPAWWLPGPHLQTIYAAMLGSRPELTVHWDRFELSDGDFLNTVWLPDGKGPIVVILHGLTGSYESPYVPRLLSVVQSLGWRGVLMHFRGCGGELNRKERTYHAAETEDVAEFVKHLQDNNPGTPIVAVGYSLGGNVLLKWLGEMGDKSPLAAVVAVSVPFDFGVSVKRFGQGLSKYYSKYLLQGMGQYFVDKYSETPAPFDVEKLKKANTFHEFDSEYTAPVHGFDSPYDYYQRASSRYYLKHIQVPTLILHSEDDPFMTADAIPDDSELSDKVTLELSERGGHVGFVTGNWPWQARYWLNERIESFLTGVISKEKIEK